MSLIKPMELVSELRGKVCGHSNKYFAVRYGTQYTGTICNPYTGEPTEAQIKVQTRFTKLADAARTILADPEQRAKYEKTYKAQHRIGSLLGYVVKKIKHQYDENGDLIQNS